MQMKLELIPLPVSDVDRAIAFYADKLGFTKDVDVQPSEGVRVVQLTPEGSGCSVGFGTGLDVYAGEPGSIRGLHLVVEDIAEARAELLRRGVEVGEIHDFGGGVRGAGFSDPDGNSFELQEMEWRKGERYSKGNGQAWLPRFSWPSCSPKASGCRCTCTSSTIPTRACLSTPA